MYNCTCSMGHIPEDLPQSLDHRSKRRGEPTEVMRVPVTPEPWEPGLGREGMDELVVPSCKPAQN